MHNSIWGGYKPGWQVYLPENMQQENLDLRGHFKKIWTWGCTRRTQCKESCINYMHNSICGACKPVWHSVLTRKFANIGIEGAFWKKFGFEGAFGLRGLFKNWGGFSNQEDTVYLLLHKWNHIHYNSLIREYNIHIQIPLQSTSITISIFNN